MMSDLAQLYSQYRLWGLIVSFSYDICEMILVRILRKIVIETSRLETHNKPHKLYYKYNLLGSAVGQLTNGEATAAPFSKYLRDHTFGS